MLSQNPILINAANCYMALTGLDRHRIDIIDDEIELEPHQAHMPRNQGLKFNIGMRLRSKVKCWLTRVMNFPSVAIRHSTFLFV